VSVGYDVEDLEIREGDNGDTVFFVTKWTPYENSIVDIAADDTVGTRSKEENISSKSSPKEKANHQNEKRSEEKMPENTPTPEAPAAPAVDVKAVEAKARQEARKAEKARATEVRALARQAEMSDEDVDSFLDGEGSVDEFRQVVVEKLVGQKKLTPVKESSDEDYREKGREFSILRMIRHRAHPGEQKFAEEAAYEREVCADAEKRFARTNQEGFIVPWTVLGQKRDLGVADNLYGGYTAKNTYGSMIEKLEQEQVTTRAGATTLAGLQGDLYIPKHTGGGTAYWVDEDGSATASTQTFGQLMLRPHTVTAMTNIHRRFYLQSSVDAENFVRQDLILRILLADDLAALHGTAANGQPRGLANVSGIGSVAIGDNGGAITFSLLVDLEKQLAQDNALLGRRAYVTNTKMACEMKQTVEHATLNGAGWVWKGGVGDGATGTVNGYPAFASNQVSSTLTKGDNSDCSAIFFGNWAEMIKARFGGLDIKVDPYTNADSGAVRVAVFQDVDVAVRHPESFAAILDARDAA
jgi:HK97 family phage major capsid protein